jgi:hypothetical protein
MTPRSPASEGVLAFAGPVVWAAHFFLLYSAGSFIEIGAMPMLAATVLALGLLILLVVRQRSAVAAAPEDRRFLRRVSIALAGLAALGIAWSTLPVLLT